MTAVDREKKIDELERLLNDPDVPMQPNRVWSLSEELAQLEGAAGQARQARPL